MDISEKSIRETLLILGAFSLGIILAAAFAHMPGTAADWASWVQAIGSIVAILVAIAVSHNESVKYRRRERLKEAGETLALLRSLADELHTLQEWTNRSFKDKVLKMDPTEGLSVFLVPPHAPFLIYEGNISKIGVITDDRLRRTLVKAYGMSGQFIDSLSNHNLIIENYNKALAYIGGQNDEYGVRETDFQRHQLVMFDVILRDEFIALDSFLIEVLDTLSESINRADIEKANVQE
jgi:hypothetical protein